MVSDLHKHLNEAIAIIGLAGIFPGSRTVHEFFRNILRKRCFVRELPEWLWEREIFFDRDASKPLKSYSHIGALLGDMNFDLTPFRIPPTVAEQMSWDQKLALVCAQEALADAGYLEREFDHERVGVILAATNGGLIQTSLETLLTRRIQARLRSIAQDEDQRHMLARLFEVYDANYPDLPITEDTLPGEIGSLVAGRIASVFDLHGMNLAIDSACASSLAAVSMGINALRTGACELVITGGVDTDLSAHSYVTFSKLSALSGQGSYPFDERADGFVMGEGCGVLILKRLSDALRDGDQIYALILGHGSSSDGAGKGITAPSSEGQLRALSRAYQDAGLSPSELHFLECHGTGTPVGDATELMSVSRLMQNLGAENRRQKPLLIGSAKAMVGHLKLAAGVAGLLRAIMAINSRVVPPQVNFEQPNPGFDWEGSLLKVPKRAGLIPDEKIYAGVSSFGFGGTNFHLVLSSSTANARPPLVAVEEYLLPELPPLSNAIAFLFPGQGSQYIGMLENFYADPVASGFLARADRIVAEISGRRLLETIYPPADMRLGEESLAAREAALRATAIAQPAIFTISVILFEKLRHLGIDFGIAIGHSLGEYSALYAAGILSFDDALRAVAIRGQLMEMSPSSQTGCMAFISAGKEAAVELIQKVEGYLICANLNSYEQTVVSGETHAVKAFVKLATSNGYNAQILNVDRAFHSRFVSACIDSMRAMLDTLSWQTTCIPIPANVSREVYPFCTDREQVGQAMCQVDRDRVIDLLCRQIDHPVDFIAQIELAYEAGARRFIEVGPRDVLTRLVGEILQGKPFQAIRLDHPKDDIRAKLTALPDLLTGPIPTPRLPLPNQPRRVAFRSPAVVESTSNMTIADQVRLIVAQVTGYSAMQISDEAEFERDLGIDSLKIFQIILHLRGTVLPSDFTNYRQATSVKKILDFAEAAKPIPKFSIENRAVSGASRAIDCFRYETIEMGRFTDHETAPQDPVNSRYQLIIDPKLLAQSVNLTSWQAFVQPDSPNAVIVWAQPDSAEELCQRTIPELLRLVVDLDEAAKQKKSNPEVCIVSLARAERYNSACFRALSALVKSFQKDLTWLHFSYYHLDTLEPEENLITWMLANPVLGRRIRAGGVVEEGRLVQHALPEIFPYELGTLLRPEDVILVTGGARGIAASIVRRLLPLVPARFLLIGRNAKIEHWIAAEGDGRVEYLMADLCDAAAVHRLRLTTRGISLVIHAAGISAARPIREIQAVELDQILGVKILGLERILAELDLSRIRGIVSFSSIASFFGGDGHPDYAAANGYLDGFSLPGMATLSIAWSAWDSVGMAINANTRQFLDLAGIKPIPVEQGESAFAALLTRFLENEPAENQNFVLEAGIGEGFFLSRDPLGARLIAGPPVTSKPVTASFGQEGLWFLEMLGGVGSTFHVAWTERFFGQLEVWALEQSLQTIVDRHEALRTVFKEIGDRCQAEALTKMPVVLTRIDLNQLAEPQKPAELKRLCQQEMKKGFSLPQGPLVRATLFRLDIEQHVLLLVFHHTVMDAYSALTFRSELASCYKEFSAGRRPALPVLPLQYGDFASRQREALKGERLEQLVSYWREKLQGIPRMLHLPTDFNRPSFQSYQAGIVEFSLSGELSRTLQELSMKAGNTLFVTFLAAFQTLLGHMSGQQDIVVGATFAGREELELLPLIGYFVNMLPLRCDLSGNPRFGELLPKVRETVMGAMEHQLPFPLLVKEMAPPRQLSAAPIFQVAMRLLYENSEDTQMPGLRQEFIELPAGGSGYDLNLMLGVGDNGVTGRFEYARALFSHATIERIAERYIHLLEAVVSNPNLRLAELASISE